MKRVKFLGVAIAGVIAVCAGEANAAPVWFCTSGPGIDLVGDGCISGESKAYPDGGDGVFDSAGGGDSEAAVETAIFDATGAEVDITLYGKSDENPSLFSIVNNGQTGSWDVLDDDVLIKYITIKAANSFALYELPGLGANSGSWTTLGIFNKGGEQPAMSHISFWLASPGVVPEPATWGMMIAGFGMVGWQLRRRKDRVVLA